MTQEEVARRVGVDRRTYSEWERGGKVPHYRVGDLRSLLGIDLAIQAPTNAAGARGEPATEPIEVIFRGYRFTLYPRAGASAEEIAAAQDQVVAAVLDKLRALGLDATPEAGSH